MIIRNRGSKYPMFKDFDPRNHYRYGFWVISSTRIIQWSSSKGVAAGSLRIG